MRRLRGANALVTGGSRGIGPHIARALAREGVNVAISARSAERLAEVATSLAIHGVGLAALPADLTIAHERGSLIDRAVDALGPIDILVNNAAVDSAGAFLALDGERVSAIVELNVVAPIELTRLVLPGMLARRRGHVVNLSSLAGKQGVPYDAVYSGTKAALVAWTHALGAEFRGAGVGFSVVCPGFVRGEGMFARFGVEAPTIPGATTPDRVACAVLRAIRRDLAEVIVNPVPVRPLLALGATVPNHVTRLLDLLGVTAFQRRKVGLDAPTGAETTPR